MIAAEPPFPPPLSREDSAEFARKRRGRNIAMLVVLVAVAALFYAIAVVKLAHPLPGVH